MTNDHRLLHQARQAVYTLLQRLYSAAPDQALLDWLQDEHPFADFPVVLDDATAAACQEIDTAQNVSLEALAADYQQLYVGFGRMQVPPWESVYRSVDKTLFDEHTLQVREMYARHGMEFVNKNKAPEDSVGIELEFMKTLTERQIAATDRQDARGERVLVDEQAAFLDDHMLAWIPMFVKRSQDFAHTDFYKGLASVLLGFLQWDRETLQELQDILPEAALDIDPTQL
jgi:TorA maturation chaperone TorD